ncbi:MAG: hypothetical protein LAQ69_24145 [Acidobacteriia bacterium]|nr:hypothetical protein [Terriglobia bacterium]
MNNQEAIGLAVFFLVILVLILVFSAHRQRAQNEIRKALIERFGSAQDLGAFLQSEGGQRFLADLSSGMSSPLGSVIGSVQKGIILVLLGLGCLLASLALNSMEVVAIGLVLGFVGLGFLISSGITHRMSRKLGLLERPSGDDRVRSSGK